MSAIVTRKSAASEAHFAVRLHGLRIATLHRRMDYTWLTFEDGYIKDPSRPVLGLHFEENLRAKQAANARLPPWFSNLLPEGDLGQLVANARNVPISREMELLAHVGHDLPGAVQVFETDDVKGRSRRPDRELIANHPQPLEDDVWRFSLAGVGMKFSMLAQDDRFTAPGVGEKGDWIIKLPDRKYNSVPLNEFVMMTLANASGIEVPDVRLVDRDQLASLPEDVWPTQERVAYAIRRFDRAPDRSLIHIEDLAQVRNFYPDDKYSGSLETVAALIYRGRDTASLLEFVRRVAFNILIVNGDAHLKNWSLIYRDPRVPTLAPAYDIVATSVYRPKELPETTGLKFCRTRRFDQITAACFSGLQSKLHVNVSLVEEVEQLVERVLAAWPQVSELLKDEPKMRSAIDVSIQRGATALRKN